jgi:hypothetical protein
MQLLDPESRYPGIAGWRDLLTQAHLAEVLGISVGNAHQRFLGRVTWTEAERAQLFVHMCERDADAAPSGEFDIRLLVGVRFFLAGQAETSMTSLTYTLQLLDAKDTRLTARDQLRIVPRCPLDGPVRIIKQNY